MTLVYIARNRKVENLTEQSEHSEVRKQKSKQEKQWKPSLEDQKVEMPLPQSLRED